jgi:hypothetical protein
MANSAPDVPAGRAVGSSTTEEACSDGVRGGFVLPSASGVHREILARRAFSRRFAAVSGAGECCGASAEGGLPDDPAACCLRRSACRRRHPASATGSLKRRRIRGFSRLARYSKSSIAHSTPGTLDARRTREPGIRGQVRGTEVLRTGIGSTRLGRVSPT